MNPNRQKGDQFAICTSAAEELKNGLQLATN